MTKEHDGLVKLLARTYSPDIHPMVKDARDLIEQQAAEIARLRGELDGQVPYTPEEVEEFQKCFDRGVLDLDAILGLSKQEKLKAARTALKGGSHD